VIKIKTITAQSRSFDFSLGLYKYPADAFSHFSAALSPCYRMARPKRNTVNCRELAAASRLTGVTRRNREIIPLEFEGTDIKRDCEPESDDDIIIFGDRCEDPEPPEWNTLLSWKEGVDSNLRSVYTKDSRATEWRRRHEKARRHDFVNFCT
jgi:hypothetical protein